MNDGLFVKIRQHLTKDQTTVCAWLSDDREYRAGDVLDVSARFANVLVELGVQPGDRVAVQVEKTIEAAMLYLATLRAGAVFLPLNTSYTAKEIGYFLSDAEPKLFVCNPDRKSELSIIAATAGVRLETLGVWHSPHESAGSLSDKALEALTEFADIDRTGDDLAAILYTSGTTGRSKGAMLSHKNLISNAEMLIAAWGISDEDVLIHALPIFHVHGLFVGLNTMLMAGGKLIFQNRFSPQAVLDAMDRATMLMGVPTYYTRLLSHDGLNRDKTKNMRLFVSGSAPLLTETFETFEQRTGHRILERYGMTETGMNTSNPLNGNRKPGTVGPPLPGVSARIADDSGKLVASGERGILEVKGPNIFKGYWRQPEKTAKEFRDDGFFITGDIATFDSDGYIAIVGRSSDMIISGGLNVYPKEIEAVLDTVPGVSETAVIGIPHADFGEGVVAVVVGGTDNLAAEDIMAHAARELAAFKVPKRVEFVDELPRNTMGKVQKSVLREKYKALFENA